MAFKSVALFGGAITTDIPATFADVSDIRQIPDNQEVYLDAQGFTSIVFEILERVDKPDTEALDYHLKDIVEGDVTEMKVWTRGEAHFAKLPLGTPAYTLIASCPPGEKQRGRPNEPDTVAVSLTLLRLAEKKTDIVIAINVPHVKGEYDPASVEFASGRWGKLVEDALGARRQILQTFDIKDWGLFVEE